MGYKSDCGREHCLSAKVLLDAYGRIILRSEIVPSGCCIWPGSKRGAYGSIMAGGFRQPFSTHRITYAAVHGPIPPGILVMHTCDVPLCCNPQHLCLGTPLENIQDRDKKGRYRRGRVYRGDENPKVKVSDAQVREIRKLAEGGEGQRATTRKYGISHTTVRMIVLGKYRSAA